MILSPRYRRCWASIKLDRTIHVSRASVQRSLVLIAVFCIVAYLLWLPIAYFFKGLHMLFSSHAPPLSVLPSGVDAIKQFAGSRDCNILQFDIYLTPLPTNPKVSPFCKNRASLLEALSNGGRHGYDEPYVGKGKSCLSSSPKHHLIDIGCTLHWFNTPEICMVLERFNAIGFVGDDITRSIYLAFNMLLREDLALGGMQDWSMSEQDRESCKCDNQFLDDCLAYSIKSSVEIKKNDGVGSSYYCDRIPHAYIPVDTVPTLSSSVNLFKDLTYLKPNPWQPSPVIFSFGHASSFDIEMTTKALDEWVALALAAERNIPILLLSPPAIGSAESNVAPWQYHQRMSTIAKPKHVDMLGLYNLTLQASTADGEHFGGKVALVEAMMIINWLSKLETS